MATETPAASRVRLTQEADEGQARVLLDWDPTQRRSAIALAEVGTMRLAADLIEAALGDDRVGGCLSARVRGLLGLPLTFEAAGDRRRAKAAIKQLEAKEDWWGMFPAEELVLLFTWAILLGVGLGELVWTRAGTRMTCRLKVWHPRWLRFDWATRQWKLTVATGAEVVVTPGDGKWVLLTPYGGSRPWAVGAWRAVTLAWLSKHFSVSDWARFNEVHGAPIVVGESPEGAQEKDWKGFAADLGNMGGRTTMALPPGYRASLLEAKGRTFETFKDQIAWADKAIAIALLGQNLTTDVEGGSLAAATIHKEVRADFIRADAEAFATALHDQALGWWALFNFGDPDLAPWPTWNTTPPEDKLARATTLKAVGDAAQSLEGAGMPPDRKELAEDYGFALDEARMQAADAASAAAREALPGGPPGNDNADGGDGESADGDPAPPGTEDAA